MKNKDYSNKVVKPIRKVQYRGDGLRWNHYTKYNTHDNGRRWPYDYDLPHYNFCLAPPK